MKKIIILLGCTTFAVFISNAQITLNSYDVIGFGKVMHQATDTLTPLTIGAINPGPAGANQTWNFSTLQAGLVDTLTSTNPVWLPNGSNFPGSNLALMINSNAVYYLKNTGTGLFIVGADGDFTGGGPTSVLFNPNEELTSFPNTYNTAFQNTSGFALSDSFTLFPGADSIRITSSKYKDVKTDGWGSLTTPLGTYNTLRQRGLVITADTIWLHTIFPNQWNNVNTNVDTAYHFAWWASGIGFPLLEMDSLKGDTIANVTWLKSLPVVGAVPENAMLKGINAYPNPSSGKFDVSVPEKVNILKTEIYSALGEKVMNASVSANNSGGVDLSSLPNGIYYLRITTKEGVATRKLVVNK